MSDRDAHWRTKPCKIVLIMVSNVFAR